MKHIKRLLAVVLVLVLVLALLAVFLPALLSSNAGRGFILRMANKDSDQKVDVGALSLAWRRAQEIADITVADPDGRQVVRIAKVTVGKSLLDLLKDSASLGVIEITDPTITVYPPPPVPEKAPPPRRERPPRERAERRAPPRKPEKAPEPARMPSLCGEIVIKGGSVLAPSAAAKLETLFEDIHATVKLDGIEKPMEFAATLLAGDGVGKLTANGTVRFPKDGLIRPSEIDLRADLSITEMDLALLAAAAAAYGEIPDVKGKVNMRAEVSGNLGDGLTIKNRANVSGLALPAEDLVLGTIELIVDGQATMTSLTLTDGRLRSEFLSADVTGVYGGTSGTFTSRAKADLGKTALLLQNLKLMPADMEVSGILQASASGSSESGKIILDQSDTVISNLVFTQAGKTMREPHLTVSQRGTISIEKETAVLAPVLISASFGTLKIPTLDVSGWSKPMPDVKTGGSADIDLAQAIQAAGTFADLPNGMTVGGRLVCDFTAALSPDGSGYIGTKTSVTGLRLKGTNFPEVADERMMIDADARLANDFKDIVFERLVVDATPVKLNAKANVSQAEGALSLGATGHLTSDLAKLSPYLTAFGMPAGTTVSGQLSGDLAADVRKGKPGNVTMDAVIEGLRVQSAGAPEMPAEKVTLALVAKVSEDLTGITVERLEVASSPVNVKATATIAKSGDAFSLGAKGEILSDFAKLSAYLTAFGMPEGTTLAGQLKAGLTADLQRGQPGTISLDSVITGLRYKGADTPEIAEDRITLTARAKVSQDLSGATLEQLDFTSSPLNLTAQGSFTQAGEDKSLTAKGNLAFDLDRLSTYVQAFAGTNLTMKGKGSKPFELSTSWKGKNVGDALRNANASAAFAVESIDGFGLHVTSLEVPLDVKSGVATVDISAKVNQGTLAVKPIADFSVDKPVLTMPPKSTLLSGLQLTPELADKTFGLIHPIFKGATAAGGTVNLTMDSFSWPLSADAQDEAAFSGKAQFNGVHLQSSGLLINLLQAIKAREREVTILSSNVTFACRNGRIESSALTLGVGRHQISITGSVGLDQTLDYQAQVPVTEDLVGKDAYKYLEGTTLNLPIKGTASKPELNAKALESAAADLAGQAARKVVEKKIEEKAGEIFKGLFDKQLKKP